MQEEIVNLSDNYDTALVTGGAGFIGSHIIDQLLDYGIKVICVDDLVAGKIENIQHHLKDENFCFEQKDISDFDKIEHLFKNVDLVFHEAASKNTVCMKDPKRDLVVNALGTLNVLEASKKYNVSKFVHASTGSVYGEPFIFPTDELHPRIPRSFYGISKTAGESCAKLYSDIYDMNITILRYFHVYGPRQNNEFPWGGVVPIFISQLYYGQTPVIFGDGEQVRSFTYVKDVVAQNMLVITKESSMGEIYNCASGIQISILDLLKRISDIMKVEVKPEFRETRTGDIRNFEVSNKKIMDLGYKFRYDFDEGLKETIEWYRDMFKTRGR